MLEPNTHQLRIALQLPSAMSYANPILETAAATSTACNLSARVAAVWQQLVLLLLEPKWTKASQRRARAATEHATIAVLPASTTRFYGRRHFSLSVHIRVASAITGEEILKPLQIQRQQKLRSLLRQLQHIA